MPLHAQWLVSMYNFFTATEGRNIVIKGWKKLELLIFQTEPQPSDKKILLKKSSEITLMITFGYKW